MMRATLVALYCLVQLLVAGANAGTTMASSSPSNNKNNAFSNDFVTKFMSDKNLPPIEVDMQLDFEISPTKLTKQQKRSLARQASKPKAKKIATAKKAKVATKPKPVAPPPPPPPKVVASKTVARVSAGAKQRKKSSGSPFGEIKRRITTAADRIAEHKYASIVWASLLFVWAPLMVIFVVNQLLGKEAFIDVLVKVFPESFPARYIEILIEDVLWVGIFGVSIVATVGTFLVEIASLGLDIAQTLSKGDSKTKKKGRKM